MGDSYNLEGVCLEKSGIGQYLAAAPACMQKHEWSEDFDEASIIQSGFISQEKLKDLYTIIAQVMRNLHLTFFLDTFYLLSPFVEATTKEHLSQGLSETLKPFAVKPPKVINLHYSSDSEAMGMVSSLFSQTLGPFLQARW